MSDMIKAIIFDWHGVLDETKLELLVNKLAEITKLDVEEVKNKLKPIERTYAQGSSAPSVFWTKVQELFSLNDEGLEAAKFSILIVRKYTLLWELLPELKVKYKLGILSDCPSDKIDVIRKTTDLSYFQTIHFSAEKHQLKDSENFFLGIINELDEKPENCLYVDDNQKHTTTAKSLGFQVCTFTKIEDLISSLKS